MSTIIKNFNTFPPGNGYIDGNYESISLRLADDSPIGTTPTIFPIVDVSIVDGGVANLSLVFGGIDVSSSAIYTLPTTLGDGTGFYITSKDIAYIGPDPSGKTLILTVSDAAIPYITNSTKSEPRTLLEKIDFCNNQVKPKYDKLHTAYNFIVIPSSIINANLLY